MKCIKTIVVFLSLFVMTSSVQSENKSDELFPTPDILKERVAFWKKVYSEFTLRDGMIHDRDYPSIVYAKIYGETNIANIKNQKERIIASLNKINTQPESTWTKNETAIVELYRQNASIDLLKGAEERVRFQQGQADRFKEGLMRSGLYLDTIRSILKQYGVPERLAYLPHVESSFNTAAYSKVGAAGLWQFMRGTGKLFGMKINYTIDERRDPIIATRGAARYLSSAYSELKEWPLAITSYNHGINGMKRAVNATGSRDLGYIIQNYESNSFKFASSNFYSCFLAASEIAENYKTYFPGLTLHPKSEFSDFTLTHYVRPDVLCKYLNITTAQLIALNPAIRSAVFEQQTKLPAGFAMHIPSSITTSSATAVLAAMPDSLKSNVPDRSQYYKVNKNDNLISIATRLGISVQDLATENKLGRKSRLMIGQLLKIPAGKAIEKPVEMVASVIPVQTVIEKKVEPAVKETLAPVSANTDALMEIAQNEVQSKIPPEELQPKTVKTEKMTVIEKPIPKPVTPVKPPVIKENKVPEPVAAIEQVADSLKEVATAPAVEVKMEKQNERPTVQGKFDISIYNLDVAISPAGAAAEITVSIDETIGHYADWLGIATSKIRKLNNMGSGSDIRINKHITIPVLQKDMIDQFIESRLEYHMAIEEDFYSQYKVSDVKSHAIQKRETLWDITNQSDNENALPLWLFKKYNKHLDLNTLVPGTIVWIPVIVEKSANDSNVSNTEYPGYYSPFDQPVRVENKGMKRTP
jgi:membrane-bound lytic murein transglycosylase D